MTWNPGVLLFATALLIVGGSSPTAALAQAKCDIADVVFMVKKERLKSDQIRRECGSSVKGASECTITKVIRLADDGMGADDIADECRQRRQHPPRDDSSGGGSRVATICATPAGSCPMMVAIPVGATCNCSGPWGMYWGQAR